MRTRPQLNGRGVTNTGMDCPLCAIDGHRTVGGEVPKLRSVEGDPRIFCIGRHGYISDEELRQGQGG